MSILKADAGFTFIEVMIAFSIISIVLLGIYQLQSQSISLGARARFNSIAPMLAREKMAEILSPGEEPPESGSGNFGNAFPLYTWKTEISDVTDDDLRETAKRLKQIDVYVYAKEENSQYHLRTYFFFDQEF